MKSIRTHTCPVCGFTDECNALPLGELMPNHNCRQCGSTWRDNGIVISGGGEPK